MNKPMIYLDNSATTPLSAAAREAMLCAMETFGNPSSLHPAGQAAQKLTDTAREQVLSGLGLRPRQKSGTLVFTSCGTEASSLALLGSVYAKERRVANRILTTDSEHPSVSRVMDRLAQSGFEVIRLSTRGGVLSADELEAALDRPILLASFMLVNNETGAVYDVGRHFRRIKAVWPDAVTHCDAVQGFLKVPFTPASLCADLISLSGHKLHAPKGVGALYIAEPIRTAKKLLPLLLGGGQEGGMRSGTENVCGIAAFGAAVADACKQGDALRQKLCDLRSYAEERLSPLELRINRPQGERAPHILNITLPSIRSETMLHALSADGICVSAGSACSSHAKTHSESLLAFGLTPSEADCSLRISFSEQNTRADIDALADSLQKNLARLVRVR
ncbi:MAG: cysteine desulfurase [Ruminococcaceae bacterium]|nr:cysteine desulfurase [Oscillospiraceae bacterium]